MRPKMRLLLWVGTSTGFLFLVAATALVVHTRAKLDFSHLDPKT
jgi:hypothetical protein